MPGKVGWVTETDRGYQILFPVVPACVPEHLKLQFRCQDCLTQHRLSLEILGGDVAIACICGNDLYLRLRPAGMSPDGKCYSFEVIEGDSED